MSDHSLLRRARRSGTRALGLCAAAIGITALSVPVAAQGTAGLDRPGVGDTSVFAPLHLWPSPNAFRLADGQPGARYWQNRADYTIQATLDTAADVLRGTLTLRYTNNSPVPLTHIWMQVEQNAFTDSSLTTIMFPAGSPFTGRGFQGGGDRIDAFEQVVNGHRVSLHTRTWDTMLHATLATPLLPGHVATLRVAWHFRVPDHGGRRMGHEGSLYEMGQWYPRVAVFDDVRGWNTDPYIGEGEFYLEYGDFDYSITLPAGYIVGGTGTLQNPTEVLTSAERARLARAARSDSVIHVITAAELASGAARPTRHGTLTWHFTAHRVRDVAWAASPNYQWDATSWKGILCNAYYRPVATSVWNDAADQARMSIMEYSTRWYRYPWPQISVTEGLVPGMEYPMLAMEATASSKPALYGVITHEIGHDWFPMLVGSNERLHYWQDEGVNTFINTFSEARRYPQLGTQEQRAARQMRLIEKTMRAGVDIPIEMPADRMTPRERGFTEYNKTSVALQVLRSVVIGPQAFDAGLRAYVQRWAYKHPTPADFFRTMDDASGQQLAWFWREWFLESDHFDQAVDSVATRTAGDTEYVDVAYGNRSRGVLPILARFTFSDGTHHDFTYPALVWERNSARYVRQYAFVGKQLTKIELDPEQREVDVDRSNNQWTP